MDKKEQKEILNKMSELSDNINLRLDTKTQTMENISYYNDFEFGKSGLAERNVYIVEISNQKERKTGDKSEQKQRKELTDDTDQLEKYTTYEIYDEDNNLIATVDKEGKVNFSEEYLDKIKSIDERYFEKLQLEDLDFELPQELKEKDIVMTKEELSEYKTKEKDEKIKEEEKDDEELDKKQEEQIAETKRIPSNNVLKVRENSNLYKDHPNLEKNLFFYKDSDGIVKAEYIDENGNPQPSQYFEPSTTALRQETVEMGNDGNPVEKETPYQVMKTKGLANTDKDVRDVRININIDQYGYLEISEARQGKNGMWEAHDVEMRGRKYNSAELNEATSMRTRKADPDKQTDAYEKVEDTSLVEDGVQYNEMYLMEHSDEIIEEFIKEGYNKNEAIDIFNLMIGEETLTEEQAKERVNEQIKEKEIEEKDNELEEDEERTPWGDAENRRNRY